MTYDEFIQNILNTRGRFSVPESEASYHPKMYGWDKR